MRGVKKGGVVFCTAVATCHPEQVRNVVVMATMETFFRTRRSFAEGTEWMEQNRRRRDLIRV